MLHKFPSTLMGVSSCLSSSIISSPHFNVFNYHVTIVVVCCLSFLHPRFPSIVAASSLGGNNTDQLALLAFKAKITEDPFQVISSWNSSIHFCEWHSVTCGRRHQRVTRLDLSSYKLVGSISPYMGNLSFLRALNLQNNSLLDEIPPELGRLPRLQFLSLDNNSLSGRIPANLSRCSNLFVLRFYGNNLVGAIPAELGSLSKLQAMIIGHNNLTGEIPHSFANLTSLQMLYAFGNNFGGSIPNALGQLKNLTFISLGANRLSGTIPPSIFNLSSLTFFSVVMNYINGSLPSYIGLTLPNLVVFLLGSNQFSGSIPNSISNSSNMEIVTIGQNNFIGKMPTLEKFHKFRILGCDSNSLGTGGADDLSFLSSLTNATNLSIITMAENKFGGTLPQSICNFSTKFELFELGDNPYMVGGIPTCLGNLINLNRLDMGGNLLTGNIPNDIGKLCKLRYLNFSGNKLNGSIPLSVGNLSLLIKLSLYQNNFQGSIPLGLEKMHNLILLDLSDNNLNGTIHRQVFSLSSLSIYLGLSRNNFSGSIPMEVGKLTNLGGLDVSYNMLTGEIPRTLGSCVMLEALYMEGNFLQGSVPSSFNFLRGIQVLDLSRNNLSGKIPRYLTGFKLKKLNLSFNDFQGEVPIEGIFKNASAILVMGNSKLCGGVLELQLPKCNFKGLKKSRSSFIRKLLIPVSCGLLTVILVLCFFLYLNWFKKSRKERCLGFLENSHLKLSYRSLLKATNGFSLDNLIGVGSFGSVYKGVLDQDGTLVVVAVKVLNLSRQGAVRSFLSECEALRNIRHRNLVKVLTACSGADYQGNDFKALVYEFMVNGNLDEWLHPIQRGEHEANEERKKIGLLQRLNIAIDVACALDYLHHHSHTLIVHCDLKPSNILLNNEMTAHVGDFGLARFLLSSSAHQTTNSTGLKGSIGYTAPEYGMGSKVSTSGDVYSYGILLLEMFTGKRPTDQMFKDGLNLHDYVKMAFPERVGDIADPILLQHGEEWNQNGANNYEIQQCLISSFGIGLSCSEETPSERLDISDIVAKLKIIKNNFIGTGGGIHGRRTGLETQS